MFGENSIYGKKVLNKDSKGRIFLPSFTGASDKDQLLLVENNENIDLYKEETYDKLIKELYGIYSNEIDIEKRLKLKSTIERLCSVILKKVSVDKQRRILITPYFNEEESIECFGAKDHLVLCKIKKR